MADINNLAPIIKSFEGGFVNDPLDRGGATNMGITIATFIQYRKLKNKPIPTVDDLKNISDEEWIDVLKFMFWDKWQADKILNQSVANILVDWFWGSGYWGIKIPQRLLGLVSDGIVGTKTITAVNSVNQEQFFNQIKQARLDFVDDIVKNNPSQVRFIKGWKRRINYFTFQP